MMGKERTYAEKLRDPRWQKKRLEILERDEWTCQLCGDKETTLVVHHRWYRKGKDPWDYPDNCLATLCESCHEQETGAISQCDGYLQMIRENLWSDDLQSLAVDIAFGGPHSYNDLSVELASRVMIHPEWFRPIFDFLEREGLMRKD